MSSYSHREKIGDCHLFPGVKQNGDCHLFIKNIAFNRVGERINVVCGTAECLKGSFDLVVANLDSREFAGADTLATSYTLSLGLARIGDYDLVLCGKQAIDGDTAQVGPEMAEHLGVPFVGFVRKIREVRPGFITVERMTDDGAEVVESPLPAVVSVVKEINEPRLPSLRGKMRAKKFEAPLWGADDIGADRGRIGMTGSPTWVARSFTPEPRGGGEILQGEESSLLVEKAVRKIRDLGVCS